jgi:hypothetical protein
MILVKKLTKYLNNRYLTAFVFVSFSIFFLGSVLFFFTYLLPDTEIARAEEQKLVSVNNEPILEVHIANNGMVYIQNAHVESVSGTTIIITTSWDKTKFYWTIITNGSRYGKRQFGTSFFDSKGNELTIKDIKIGNIITVNGTFNTNYIEPTVKADVIRTSY